MKTQISVITAEDEFELIKKFNKDPKEAFATKIQQKIDGSWVMFCYSPQNKNTQRISDVVLTKFQPSKTSFNKQAGTGSVDIPATKSQLDYIHGNNLDVNTRNLTKSEAWKIIKEHKEKR